MVKFTGLCPSLKKSVEFDVTEIIELPTKRGVKYQVKGDFEGRTCSTFTSKAKAMTLREAIGGRTMAAEEDSTGQAHQEDGVNPLRGEVEPLAQGQEPSSQLPLKETVSEPITGTDVGVEPIESLELPDLPESSMGTQFDEAPAMEGDIEIASMMPEGDGQSIGNNAPMNPDVPLHAEETSEEVGQEEPSAEQLPLSETVPESFSPADSQVAPIDDLSVSMADPVSRMEVEFDQAPEIITEFTISMPQPFGDGRSIGNITPMNPDVPFASESVDFNADPLDETSLEVPPAVCFVEKIPPVVWENMTLETKMEYAETGNEGLLVCPQCGITKEGLRDVGGYCSVSDPEGESYDSSIDCPYQKHFAPSHWVDSEIVVEHITESEVEVSERLPSSVDMPMNDAITSRLLYTKIPFFLWDKINSLVGAGVQAFPDDSGLNYTLQYYGNQKNHLDNLINVAEGETDIMFGSERYHATVLASEDGGYYIKTDSLRPYGAEEDKGRYGHMFDYPIVYADDSSDRRGYLIGYDNGEIWNTGIMYGGIERNRDFINDVGQQRLKRRNLRRENSSTDDPDFDPEKADRNKDGVISDWERAVGNAVAKGIRESREKKGAETFGVEFDDWAEQEMLTHGETVSFKEWAKEEGKKHGDMDLTDWAEEEEESHDERYGAEESMNPKDYIAISFLDQQGNGHPTTLLNTYDLRFGERGSTYFKALREALDKGVKRGDYDGYKIKKTTSKPLMDADFDYETPYNNEYGYQVWLMGDKFFYGDSDIPVVKKNKYTINEGEPKFADMVSLITTPKKKRTEPMDNLGSLFGAETFDADKDGEDFYDERMPSSLRMANTHWELLTANSRIMFIEDYTPEMNYRTGLAMGTDRIPLNIQELSRTIGMNLKETIQNLILYSIRFGWITDSAGRMIQRQLNRDWDDYPEWIRSQPKPKVVQENLPEPEVAQETQTIVEIDSNETQDRPSLKKLGILLGVGALATYLAPENIKKFFNR